MLFQSSQFAQPAAGDSSVGVTSAGLHSQQGSCRDISPRAGAAWQHGCENSCRRSRRRQCSCVKSRCGHRHRRVRRRARCARVDERGCQARRTVGSAVTRPDAAQVAFLLADVNVAGGCGGETALHYAAGSRSSRDRAWPDPAAAGAGACCSAAGQAARAGSGGVRQGVTRAAQLLTLCSGGCASGHCACRRISTRADESCRTGSRSSRDRAWPDPAAAGAGACCSSADVALLLLGARAQLDRMQSVKLLICDAD